MRHTEVKGNILVIDDQENWREVLSSPLGMEYVVQEAASYEEAIKLLQRQWFHLAIIDIRLVDEDPKNVQGMELLETIRKDSDVTSTIIVTAYPTIETVKKALHGFKADDYILKHSPEDGSFKLREYRKSVQQAVEKAKGLYEKEDSTSKLDLITGMSLQQMADAIATHGEIAKSKTAKRDFKIELGSLVTDLLRGLSPLIPHPNGARVSQGIMGGATIETDYWSKMLGKAITVRFGAKDEVDLNVSDKVRESLTPHLAGVVCLSEMPFETFSADHPAGGKRIESKVH